MNKDMVAGLIMEGTKIIGEIIKHKHILFPAKPEPPKQPVTIPATRYPSHPQTVSLERSRIAVSTDKTPPNENYTAVDGEKRQVAKASAVATGCVPCALGHFGTCTGLLNEAMRFAHKDGVATDEVIDRMNMCMDELNTMERVDLRPEMIAGLDEWEKELAQEALRASRTLRHEIESIPTEEDLEKIAAKTQSTRAEIGRAYFKEKFNRLTTREKELVRAKIREKAEEIRNESGDRV